MIKKGGSQLCNSVSSVIRTKYWLGSSNNNPNSSWSNVGEELSRTEDLLTLVPMNTYACISQDTVKKTARV